MSQQSSQVFGGRYEIHRHIARGGMAEVYLARDLLLDRPVALKVLFAELSTDPAFVERFRREAQAAANLSHPNIVSVYDWGEEEGTYFIVMEYIEGRSLAAAVRAEAPMLADRAADIGAEVAAALAFAHRNGVIHRDVKPGNVVINPNGQVKVTDFGIARAANSTDADLTQAGAVMGTATYFSPEQAQGRPVDARSDVYSLGVVLYELVVGRPPFSGDSPVAIAYKHVGELPVPPRSVNPSVPAEFEAIVLKALDKDPARRYDSAEDLRADLLRFRQGRPVLAASHVQAATMAAPVVTGQATTVHETYRETGTMLPGGPPPPRRTGAYVVLLFAMLAALAALLFLFGRQLGVVGDDDATQVAVPQVIGQTQAEAEQMLTDAGLEFTVTEQPNEEAEPGTVFDSDPDPGERVDEGTSVELFVSAGGAEVTVPDVVGDDVEDATDELEAAGLEVTTTNVADDTAEPGTVLSQTPAANETVAEGTTVTLTVSAGPETVDVPDVSGRTVAEAAAILGRAGFEVTEGDAEPHATVKSGSVIRTEPAAGEPAEKGSTVTIIPSSGPRATTTTHVTVRVPDVVGLTESQARQELINAGFQVSIQRENTTDRSRDGEVIDQTPNGGSTAAEGSTVTIVVGRYIFNEQTTTTSSPPP